MRLSPTHSVGKIGSIPRLWEIRHLMEEMKASADPAVMYGAHYFLNLLMPSCVSRWILNAIHRNSSLYVSNLQGPTASLAVGSHRLQQLFYWPSTPPDIGVSINMTSYQTKLLVSISTTSILIPSAKKLSKLLHKHVNLLADLLSKRRVPGESRSKKRPHHVIIEAPVGSGRLIPQHDPDHLSTSVSASSNLTTSRKSISATSVASGPDAAALANASVGELTDRLHAVQEELNDLSESLESGILYDENGDSLNSRMEDLKDEFSDLMKNLRRRKSIADYGPNIIINLEVGEVEKFICLHPFFSILCVIACLIASLGCSFLPPL